MKKATVGFVIVLSGVLILGCGSKPDPADKAFNDELNAAAAKQGGAPKATPRRLKNFTFQGTKPPTRGDACLSASA